MNFKKMIVGVLIASGLIAAGTSSFAVMDNDVTIYYYSDASKSIRVGYFYQACSGRVMRTGQVTPYEVETNTPCRSSQPPIKSPWDIKW